MNEQNLSYLKDTLKYLGFGESLNESLAQRMADGAKDFTLSLDTEVGRKPFGATLHFRKGDTSDTYFFNKWDATLKTEEGTAGQTFYINRGHGITLKEGYNLLEGRSVHKELTGKEGQKYSAWLELDKSVMDTNGNYKLKQYHQNYGFDLEKTLAHLPIKELQSPEQKEALLRSLRRGNLQAVTFEKNNFIEKLFIEAAPRFKSINAYEPGGTPVPMKELDRRYELSAAPAPAQEVSVLGKAQDKVNNKPVVRQEGPSVDASVAPSPGRARAQAPGTAGSEDGLLPKKRVSGGKGLQP